MEVPEGEPTPEEILEMCKEIRAGWSDTKKRDTRRQETVPWQVKVSKTPDGL
jgi:hypothetical protein